jgi:hypothetical protein
LMFEERPADEQSGGIWSDSDGLTPTVAVESQITVCCAISSASSTSIPKKLI